MLVTRSSAIADRVRYLSTQARQPVDHYEHTEIGFNYRLSNLLAAIGRGQLRVLGDFVEKRRANFEYNRQTLENLPGLSFMPEIADGRSTRWLTCLTIDPGQFGATLEEVRLALAAENIESRAIWKPMHLQPAFADCEIRGGTVSEELFRNGLSLPSGSNMQQEDLDRVVRIIQNLAESKEQIDRLHLVRAV